MSELRFEDLQPGDEVTVFDVTGARFFGSVVARRSIDEPDELTIRRRGGQTSTFRRARVTKIVRGEAT